MRIWLVGGGTAGHVVPLLVLAAELKDHDVTLISDHTPAAGQLPGDNIVRIRTGKFRRYHGRKLWQRLFDIKTLILNLRDVILILIGLVQSLLYSFKRRPDVVFLNGGAIGVPVGLVCRWRRIPYLVHESDVLPGLANRLVAGGAKRLLFGLEPPVSVRQRFRVPADVVGVQLRPEFLRPPSQADVRQKLGWPENEPVVLVTGGSLGARQLNRVVQASLAQLTADARIVHIVGRGNVNEAESARQNLPPEKRKRYEIIEYESQRMALLMAAADIVISRAGATTLAELAQLGKAALIVPNPLLTGGHQSLNAAAFTKAKAAVALEQNELVKKPELLAEAVWTLLNDESKRAQLTSAIGRMAKPDATERIISHILAVGQGRGAAHGPA